MDVTELQILVSALVELEEDKIDPLCLIDSCEHNGECPGPDIGCGDGEALLAKIHELGYVVAPAHD